MKPGYNEDSVAVRNAVGGFELLVNLFNQELQNFRGSIQEFGNRMRAFFQENFRWKKHYTEALIELAAKGNNDVYMEYSKRRNGSEGREMTYTIPSVTFNDVASVLLTDDVCEGILLEYMLKSPKWEKLPERVIVPREFDACSEFQLWNRPVSMTADEEDERLSLPSTRCTDWEKEKMTTVEAQLAMLTRQMQLLLQTQQQQQAASLSRGGTPTHSARCSSPSDDSEDEGRGGSLCSPSATLKKNSNTIASLAPPPGPPPPAPPPNLFASIENKVVVTKSQPRVVTSEEDARVNQNLPNRPTMADLKAVQLRKVDAARSPGGTPQARSRIKNITKADQGGMLEAALKDKFRTLQNSFSEQEDCDSTWAEDEECF